MMLVDVCDALLLKLWYQFWVKHQVLQLLIYALIVGLHIDDGTEMLLVDNLVVFRFSTTYADDALAIASSGFIEGV